MEIGFILAIILLLISICTIYFYFETRMKSINGDLDKMLDLSKDIVFSNGKIINAIPQAKKNVEDTNRILDLAEKQQLQIATIRQDWLRANMLLNEVCDAMSRMGGKPKPDEALHYMLLAKKKLKGQHIVPGVKTVEVTVDDSHTSNFTALRKRTNPKGENDESSNRNS